MKHYKSKEKYILPSSVHLVVHTSQCLTRGGSPELAQESSQCRSDSWKQIEITWQPLLITAVFYFGDVSGLWDPSKKILEVYLEFFGYIGVPPWSSAPAQPVKGRRRRGLRYDTSISKVDGGFDRCTHQGQITQKLAPVFDSLILLIDG